ncbi:hypothetical protein ACQPZG_00675 (plasmid) [Streptomyces sp. CA-294286]
MDFPSFFLTPAGTEGAVSHGENQARGNPAALLLPYATSCGPPGRETPAE